MVTEEMVNETLRMGLRAYKAEVKRGHKEMAHEILVVTSKICEDWLDKLQPFRHTGEPVMSKSGYNIERCPECDDPLTVTKWGLNEEAVCNGCGYTETNNFLRYE